MKNAATVTEYIDNNRHKTVRRYDGSPFQMELPKPFSVPSMDGEFISMFYWDTYFINVGLIELGDFEQAANNLENMRYLVGIYGFVPNSSKTNMTGCSQPPLYCMGVADLYAATKDDKLLEFHLPALVREHEFWMTQRITETGLNRHYCYTPPEGFEYYCSFVTARLGVAVDDFVDTGRRFMSEAESGWDYTPRFSHAAPDYLPVDLNSILYYNENTIAGMYKKLNRPEESAVYAKKAEKRLALMQKYMRSDSMYNDYNYVEDRLSELVSAACFLPFVCGITVDKDAVKNVLSALEYPFGVSAAERNNISSVKLQWDYPNMWAPLVFFAVKALYACGEEGAALRIAGKYVAAVDKVYAVTGCLYEKYDAVTGVQSGHNEYALCEMLGWTMGVYLYCKHLSEEKR
jgi:alpha,alpha-trehalase